MRKIEFRGKVWNCTKNEWIWKYGPDMFGFIGSQPETIGQYIGRKDKNGVKIYEGDVLRFLWDSPFGPVDFFGVVRFVESVAAFCYLDETLKAWNTFHIDNNDITVVGNIFDNPSFREKFCEYWEEGNKE